MLLVFCEENNDGGCMFELNSVEEGEQTPDGMTATIADLEQQLATEINTHGTFLLSTYNTLIKALISTGDTEKAKEYLRINNSNWAKQVLVTKYQQENKLDSAYLYLNQVTLTNRGDSLYYDLLNVELTSMVQSDSISLASHNNMLYELDTLEISDLSKTIAQSTLANQQGYVYNRGILRDSTTLSAKRSIEDTSADAKIWFELYPNPSKGLVTLHTNSEEEYEVKIYNALGQEVIQQNAEGDLSLQIHPLNAGIYFVNIILNGKKYESKKLFLFK